MTMLSRATSYQNFHLNRWAQTERMQNPRENSRNKPCITSDTDRITQIIHPHAEKNPLLYPSIKSAAQDLINQDFPVQGLKTLPKKKLGSGKQAEVYSCKDKNRKPAALKIESTDYAYYGEASPRKQMEESFKKSKDLALMVKAQPSTPHLLSVRGLCYVEEIDKWGVVYEKINGTTWKNYRTTITAANVIPVVLKVMKGTAKGLQILDQAGWPHRDLHERNIMIRSDGSAVVIDLPNCPRPEHDSCPLTSRAQFGYLLDSALDASQSRDESYKSLNQLVIDCTSGDKSLDEFYWQHIIDELDKIQQEYMQKKLGSKE